MIVDINISLSKRRELGVFKFIFAVPSKGSSCFERHNKGHNVFFAIFPLSFPERILSYPFLRYLMFLRMTFFLIYRK